MKAWLLEKAVNLESEMRPLKLAEIPRPVPREHDILIRVLCCGVCHTEIDEIEGRTLPPVLPVVPGHQVIGMVEEVGGQVNRFSNGDRVGVAWIFSACGRCEYCQAGLENLCPDFVATGRDRPGGYAEWMVIDQRYAYAIPTGLSDHEAAPLLCAGAIGYRSLKLAAISNGQTLGFSGFGASAHLTLKLARYLYPNSPLYVFARSETERNFASKLGADWTGDFDQRPPVAMKAIIDTTPAWMPVNRSLLFLKPGGRLVINAIRKESTDNQSLSDIRYEDHLWMEKEIKSVANITRKDVEEFLPLAVKAGIKPVVELYPFADANQAIMDMKHGQVKGAKVLVL